MSATRGGNVRITATSLVNVTAALVKLERNCEPSVVPSSVPLAVSKRSGPESDLARELRDRGKTGFSYRQCEFASCKKRDS